MDQLERARSPEVGRRGGPRTGSEAGPPERLTAEANSLARAGQLMNVEAARGDDGSPEQGFN